MDNNPRNEVDKARAVKEGEDILTFWEDKVVENVHGLYRNNGSS